MRTEFSNTIGELRQLGFEEEIAKNEDVLPSWRGDEWSMKLVVEHGWLGKLVIDVTWYVLYESDREFPVPIKEIFNPYNSDRDGNFWMIISKLYKDGKTSSDSLINCKFDMDLLKRVLNDDMISKHGKGI